MEVQPHASASFPVEQGDIPGAEHAENQGVHLGEVGVPQGDFSALLQHGLPAVVEDHALGGEQVGVRPLGLVEEELVVLKVLSLRNADSGVSSDAEGHGGGSGVFHREGGGKAVLQQLVGHLQGEGEGVLGQGGLVLPQLEGDEVLPLVHRRELHPPGEAVAAHLIGLAADVHPAVLQGAHNGE